MVEKWLPVSQFLCRVITCSEIDCQLKRINSCCDEEKIRVPNRSFRSLIPVGVGRVLNSPFATPLKAIFARTGMTTTGAHTESRHQRDLFGKTFTQYGRYKAKVYSCDGDGRKGRVWVGGLIEFFRAIIDECWTSPREGQAVI